MRASKWVFPLVLLVAIYFYSQRHQDPAVPTETVESLTEVTPSTPKPIPPSDVNSRGSEPAGPPHANQIRVNPSAKTTEASGPKIVVTSPDQLSGDANPFAGATNSIPFRIDGPWAIAYGDVLLGTVSAPQGVKTGTHRPEKPRLWDSPTIPYGIHADLSNKERVEAAIRYFNENTVVRFVPVEGHEEDALIFVPDEKNCASYIGRIGGMQPIMVANKCGPQELIHELMHALGFVHEHSRTDRDQHLEVIWDNIETEFWPQFALVPEILIHEYRGRVFDFDPHSAMLYPPTAFGKENGVVTLKAKPGSQINPVTEGLSQVDRERLFYLYGS